MVPILLLVAVVTLPLLWIQRKFAGKNLSPARLLVTVDEMQLIEEASSAWRPIFINDVEITLQPFNAEHKHFHSNCGSCPDELHLDDTRGRPRLTASREVGESSWRVAAMEPILWSLLGHTSSDLINLRVNGVAVGRPENSSIHT